MDPADRDELRDDDLTDDDHAALNRALELSMQQAKAGNVRPASEIIDEIRRRT